MLPAPPAVIYVPAARLCSTNPFSCSCCSQVAGTQCRVCHLLLKSFRSGSCCSKPPQDHRAPRGLLERSCQAGGAQGYRMELSHPQGWHQAVPTTPVEQERVSQSLPCPRSGHSRLQQPGGGEGRRGKGNRGRPGGGSRAGGASPCPGAELSLSGEVSRSRGARSHGEGGVKGGGS